MSLLINKLDYYVAKKTASRLNLYVKQEDRLHNEVEKLFDDVKGEVTIIRSAINAFPNKEKRITSDDVDTFVKTLKPKVGTILEKSSLRLSSFLSDLSKKQQELFLQDLEKKNKKTQKAQYNKDDIDHVQKNALIVLIGFVIFLTSYKILSCPFGVHNLSFWCP